MAPVLENFEDGWNLLGSDQSADAGNTRCIALSRKNCQELCYVFCSLKDPVVGSRTLSPPLFPSGNRLNRQMAAATVVAKSLHCARRWSTASLWISAFFARGADASRKPLSYPQTG